MTHSDYDKPFLIPRTNFVSDSRGYFDETKFPDGFDFVVRQISESYGRYKVVKGLHLHYDMAKMVRAIEGSIIDIVVDFRISTENFLKVYEFELYPDNCWLYIPPGYAHGVIHKTGGKIQYLFSERYKEENCQTIFLFDPDIPYPKNGLVSTFCLYNYNFVMSQKDLKGMSIKSWLSQ